MKILILALLIFATIESSANTLPSGATQDLPCAIYREEVVDLEAEISRITKKREFFESNTLYFRFLTWKLGAMEKALVSADEVVERCLAKYK